MLKVTSKLSPSQMCDPVPSRLPLCEFDAGAFACSRSREDRLFALYALAIDSGCRQGEMLGLTWNDIDFERSTVSITKSLEEVGWDLALKATKNKTSTRLIAISNFTLDAIQEHREAMLAEGSYRADGPVFRSSRNESWLRKSDVFRRSFTPIPERAGLSFRFHDLRHCCASFSIEAGEDLKTIHHPLGHSTATMALNTYGHVFQKAQAGAALKMGNILTAAKFRKMTATA